MTSLLLGSMVPSVKWAQQLLAKQSPNERPLMAVELCDYPHHRSLLLLICPGRCAKGGESRKESKNKENKLRLQSRTQSQLGLTPVLITAGCSFPVTFPQQKTCYHLTRPWELGPNSPNGKPAGPVCWDTVTPLDLVSGCPPTALQLLPGPAQQGDLGKSPDLP